MNPLSDSEIIDIGFRAGFAVDSIENEETGEEETGFLDEAGYIDNEPFIKFVRLIEQTYGIV